MATLIDKFNFVTAMAGNAADAEKALKRRDDRQTQLQKLVGAGLADSARNELREAMTFSVERRDGKGSVQSMDERGQRQSIETEDARTDYKSISPADEKKVRVALEKIIKIRDQMLAAKDDDGEPLFTEADLVNELFTPLVREGLLPENLVMDEHSETAKLLKATIASYKQMLANLKLEKEKAAAKTESDLRNAGTKMDRLKALGSKAGEFAQSQVSELASRTGMTPDELKRAANIGAKGVGAVMSMKSAVSTGMDLDDKIKGVAPKVSVPLGTDLTAPDFTGLIAPKLDSAWDSVVSQLGGVADGAVLNQVLSQVGETLNSAGFKLEDVLNRSSAEVVKLIKSFGKLLASDGIAIATDVALAIKEMAAGGIDMGGDIGSRAVIDPELIVRKAELRAAARQLGSAIDLALQQAMLPFNVSASQAMSGKFAANFNSDTLYELTVGAVDETVKLKPQAKAVLELIAPAMGTALAATEPAFKPHAAELGKAFLSQAGKAEGALGNALRPGGTMDPQTLFTPLVPAARMAAAELFASTAFQTVLNDQNVTDALTQSARDANDDMNDELAAAADEMADFERALVLIDEGGMASAKQNSLAELIAQIEADRLDLSIVAKAGSLLGGAGGALTKMSVDASNKAGGALLDQTASVTKTVATQVGQSLVPALQAAQLVMKMSVTILKIAERAKIARKFKADVEKARKARSPLQDSIQNFYQNKVEQQVYASIELALQTVQLAGSICSSVPEPITMAVGKALTAAAQATQAATDLAHVVHDEVEIRNAWRLTLAAINNPKNRRAGLDALRHNPTLAVHSVAWAATQGDPMGMEIMRSCGVNAQTMADDDSDADAVITYLETLLSEDRQVKDTEKIPVDWVPSPLVLSYAAWFTVKQRALKAVPAFNGMATPAIDQALKALDVQPTVAILRASLADHASLIERLHQEAEQARLAFTAFKPSTGDNTPHTELAEVCDILADRSAERRDQLAKLKAALPQALANRADLERWRREIPEAAPLKPQRDALTGLRRIGSEIRQARGRGDERWGTDLAGLLIELDKAETKVSNDLQRFADGEQSRWERECNNAKTRPANAMQPVITRVTNEMKLLQAELTFAGLDPALKVAQKALTELVEQRQTATAN